ncbi:MAG: molybdopterin-dependent oxidoreductase [Chloroflexi bacterium]|nr:molybdopterin-dependent oxidoreductase [Chloroflexota bacterium]
MPQASPVTADEIVKTNCMLCVNSCGLDAHVKDGRVVKVEGMKEHPLNKGLICPRGNRIVEWEYAPERLLYPQRRVGDGFQRITWDEALSAIISKMNEIKEREGPRAVAIQVGALGAEERESQTLSQRFAAVFGTPNYLNPGI